MEFLLKHKVTVELLALVSLMTQFFGKISSENIPTMVFGGATGFILAYALNKNRA